MLDPRSETITEPADFDYLHKKQTGGAGQFGRVVGCAPVATPVHTCLLLCRSSDPAGARRGRRLEPLDPNAEEKTEFQNHLVGNAIPPEYVAAIEKGFDEAVAKGPLVGALIEGVRCAQRLGPPQQRTSVNTGACRMIVSDGKSHEVDSSEMAFKTASMMAFRQGERAHVGRRHPG